MKRLLIDLEKCQECEKCVAECSYFYHRQNNGITSIRELATFAVVCRRCEEAPCVASCYHKALQKDSQGILHRARFLCTGCKTCSIACPFGVIMPDFLVFLDARCDYCLSRRETTCIKTCPHGALEVADLEHEDIEEGIYFVSDSLAVRSRKWFADDLKLYKKR